MASANLDLARSIYAGRGRGDYSSAEWAHPEIEFVIADGPNPGSWKGLAGMAEGWRAWASAWDEFRGEADEYRELDDERVLVLVHMRGRGKTSGLELEQLRAKGATLYQIRDGKVIRAVHYLDCERALRPPRPCSGGWLPALVRTNLCPRRSSGAELAIESSSHERRYWGNVPGHDRAHQALRKCLQPA